MANTLSDFKPGPLDVYRKKASFDWKKLKVFLEGEEIIKYQNEIFDVLKSHPEFQDDELHTKDFVELRRIAARRTFAHKSIDLLSIPYIIMDPKRAAPSTRIMMQFSPSSSIKFSVTDSLFTSVVRSMGTERHEQYMFDAEAGNIIGCYCLTEIGHGSNARGMRTTATYDKSKKVFVLHSEDFAAAKCWAGGLGQIATHAAVYAQLIIDGVKHGLHCFVVPIRDPKTMLPYPGLIVGDMGEKIGLNGIDNGILLLNKYEVPRENLLNKLGDVTEDGQYITPYKDPNKRHGAALGALSAGRVAITAICEAYGVKALTIAVRYAAVRKQFGPDDENELPVLEYQTHQYRLMPYLAAAYVLRIFTTYFMEQFYIFAIDQAMGNNKDALPDLGVEIHGLSSATKPMSGWIMKEAIQECRECCGGHGYLKASGLGDIRNDNDANITYEGENHVLIQQTGNWLLKFWPAILKRQTISTPLHSADFLTNGLDILENTRFTARSIDEISNPKFIMSVYEWLIVYLLKRTNDKLESDLKVKTNFWAKNDNQIFYAKNLSVAFIQRYFLQITLQKISETNDVSIKNVLTKIFSLYALWSLEKHLPTLYQGGLAQGSEPTTLIQDGILRLCAELKDDAVSLVDTIGPPDFILNSVLGASDGEVYKHLQSAILRSPHALSRPEWWREVTNWKDYIVPVSKL